METKPLMTFQQPDSPHGKATPGPGKTVCTGARTPLDEGRLRQLLEELGREARRFRFEVAPNPCVGAAILADGEVIGRGYHRSWGSGHAEVEALAEAARSGVPRESWDLAVVTLEPCSTTGKTPPCTSALVESGVPRVLVAEVDPDPRHRGASLEMLRQQGLEVLRLEGAAPLEELSPHFLRWNSVERLRRERPWVIAKWAQTRSGQLQPPEDIGEGRWISGAESRREVHELRSRVDAIVTGVGTVLSDDPRLTIREGVEQGEAPLRVVLDSYLRTPPDAALFRAPEGEERAGRVLILTVAGADGSRWRALEAAGAEVRGLHTEDGHRLDLREVQEELWGLGVRRVLLEAGPTLLEAMLEREYVDQVRVYTGDVIGGRGPTMAAWFAGARLEERLDRECGEDAVLEFFPG